MSVKVTATGPLFDGTAETEMDRARQDINEEIAQEVYDAVRTELKSVLQHPTGHYLSRVQIERASNDLAVTDGGVVYGPWLEGVSSRNSRTRFKGYTTFRRMTRRVESRAGAIAERVLDRHIGRMQ